MKKWKIVLSAILLTVAATVCGTAIGCKKGSSNAKKWTTNSVEHWRLDENGEDIEGSRGEHNFNKNYHCTTCGYNLELAGIEVTKRTTDYELNNRLTTRVATQDITVKGIAEDGLSEVAINSGFELKYYDGDKEIDNLNAVGGGAYNIWVTASVAGAKYESFVVVYVVDKVVEFERDATATFKSEQNIGLDEMTDTWKFKVTYSSGRTETVGVNDEHVSVTNFSTYVATSSKTATITYSETDCKGGVVTMDQTVVYKVVKSESSNVTSHELKLDGFGTLADKTALAQDNFTGDNDFLTVVEGGTANYRDGSSGDKCVEIKDNALTVTFDGVGIIVIGCRSTSNGTYSSIAVRDSEGNYLEATYNASANVVKDNSENWYAVTGQSANNLTFTITKPGTYTICTVGEVTSDEEIITTARNTRVLSIEMTDILTTATTAEVE